MRKAPRALARGAFVVGASSPPGAGTLPADTIVAVLNIAITDPATDGYATAYPCGTVVPLAAAVNFHAGETTSNSATVAVGTAGEMCVIASADANVVVDVQGVHSASGTGFLLGLTPARLTDSRETGMKVAGAITQIQVTGRGGVPANATAVALNEPAAVTLNVAVVVPATAGFLTVYPCGTPTPLAANANFVAGQTVSNSVTVGLGTGGKVCVLTTSATDLVVDVTAAFGQWKFR